MDGRVRGGVTAQRGPDVKRLIPWLAENADAVVALTLAVFVSILGLLGVVQNNIVSNAIVLTLATLAFVMLRDRNRQAVVARQIQGSIVRANAELLELFAKFQQRSTIKILVGSEISRELAASRSVTDQLTFKGATGTFTRAVALPECIDAARRDRKGLRARIEIFDPGNEKLLASYAELYRSFAEEAGAPENDWTVDGTRREILATILAACWQKERFRLLLDIEVFLSSTMTTFRWDLTHGCLIITQRGPQFPAMLIERNDIYYTCWSTELHASMQLAKRLPIENAFGIPLGAKPAVPAVRELFSRLGIHIPDEYGDDDINEVINKALHDKNPYE
jgi:hypothetical protein